MTIRTSLLAAASRLAAVLFLAGFSNFAGAAGLVEVTQTIFGMDCAPCAHGVQKSLEKLDGVSNATISLNAGTARVQFAGDNSVSLEQIHEAIRENGFTPKEAQLAVEGKLSRREGQPILTFADQQLRLATATESGALSREIERAVPGVSVLVKGKVEESDPDRILVSGLERAE